MKKNTILKVLSFVLLLTFVFSAVLMTGCGKQEDAAKQTDLEATNADLKSAQDEITKLQTAIEKLQEASATSEELSRKVAALETALEAVSGDPEAIQGLVADIEGARAELQTAQEELSAAVQEATEALENLDDIYATDAQLATEISTLKNGVIKDLQTAVAALQGATSADEDLSELVAIINDRLVKSDWIEATDVLFDDDNPKSIASFKSGIVRNYGENPNHPLWRIAIQYEDSDIKAYEAKADLLEKKLLRAISIEDIDNTFALRDAELASLVKIVDKFEAQLVEWEPDRDENGDFIQGTGKLGFPSVVGDQLARLKYLHGLIVARDLYITSSQENRYQALLAAVDRLREAEEMDLTIYEGPANHPTQTSLGLAKWDLVEYRNTTLANLNTIKGLYDQKVAPLFADAKKTIYYAVGMEDLPFYINYLNKRDRYKELDDAKKAFEKKYPELTHFQDYNMSDPMLDAYDSIEKVDGAWLDSWKEKYKLVLNEETVNCFLIIDPIDQENDNRLGGDHGTGYGRILAIRHYVQTLYYLNETYVKPIVYKDPNEEGVVTKSLIPQIKVEIGVEDAALKVKWVHLPTLRDILDKQDIIYDTIDNMKFYLEVAEFVADFTYGEFSVDGALVPLCKRTMIGQSKSGEATLAEIRYRVEDLEDTMQDLLDLNEYLLDRFYQNEQLLVVLPYGANINALANYKVGPVKAITEFEEYKEDNEWVIDFYRSSDVDEFVEECEGLIEEYTLYDATNNVYIVKLAENVSIEDLLAIDVNGTEIDEYSKLTKWIISLRHNIKAADVESFIFSGTQHRKAKWVATLADSNYVKKELDGIVNGFFMDRDIYITDDNTDINKENYDIMTKFFRYSIKPYLDAAIDNLTEVLTQIYRSVKPSMYDENGNVKQSYLPDLNKLIVAQAEVFKVIGTANVNTTDFVLDRKADGSVINFSDFFNELVSKVVRLVDLAQNANVDAVEINEKIELLEGKFNLNKTAVVDEVAEMLIDWAETYLGVSFRAMADAEVSWAENCEAYIAEIAQYFVDTEITEKALIYPIYIVEDGAVVADEDEYYEYDIKVANDGILSIGKYVDETTTSTETYTFITGANFNAFKETQAARVARYNAAIAAWADLDMTPTANRYDIDKSFEDFTNYVKEYYTNIETIEDEWTAAAKYYHIRQATEEEIEASLEGTTPPQYPVEGIKYVEDDEDEEVIWTVCYPTYKHSFDADNNDKGVVYQTKDGVKVPVVTKSADALYGDLVQEKLDYENQWANDYRGAAVSMALREKAERFASYLTGAKFFYEDEAEAYTIVEAEDYVGEFGELIAYRALLDRSAQYDRIMFLAELLDKTTVPTASEEEGQYILEEVLEELDGYTAVELDEIVLELMIQNVEELETVTRELKDRIADFCDIFDYFEYETRDVYEFEYDRYQNGDYVVDDDNAVLILDEDDGAPVFALDDDGKLVSTGVTYDAKIGILPIYDDAKVAANGQSLDAELAAYVGAVKVYIINAFENDGDEENPYYYYVRKKIVTDGETYVLPEDEAIVLTTYCVEMIQKAGFSVEFVDLQLGVFRSQALKANASADETYPEFDFDSEDHFLKTGEEEVIDFAELFADYPARPVRPEEMDNDDEWADIWNKYLEDLFDWHVDHQDAQKDLLASRAN